MTYCIGVRLDAGMVFLSDSRTNAGLDRISTFRKMMIYEKRDERFMTLLTAGNFIEATRETCFFQAGESKYGKPILDRMLTPATTLAEAAKCALVSMDSTMKSNLSVGLPLDLLVYENNQFQTRKVVCIDERNPYFQSIRTGWGQRLKQAFESIDDPQWNGGKAQHPLCTPSVYEPLRKITHPGEKIV